MKILQINNHHYKHGGAEIVYLNTIDLLRNQGHIVITLSRKKEAVFSNEQYEYFIPYSNSLKDRFYSSKANELIKKIIINEKPDIAHIHNIIGGITFSILPVLRDHRIPVVATLHDYKLLCPSCNFIDGNVQICEKCKVGKYYNCTINRCSSTGYFRSFLWSCENYLRDSLFPFNQLIDKYIFVSKFSKNKHLEFYPDLLSKSNQIYNFTTNLKLNINRGKYFLYYGRLSREKGLLTLLNAFKELPELNLKIVGNGNLMSSLEMNKTPNIELVSFKSGKELHDIIQNSSFVIVPSECFENNPMAIVESFALGKPVIGANLGGIPEVIENKKTGFLFKSTDWKSLVEIVKESSQLSLEKYVELSNQAFNFASEKFSPEIYYDQLMKIYNEVLH
jgi:glycosyltransferase involved in cell wall biosynthesis